MPRAEVGTTGAPTALRMEHFTPLSALLGGALIGLAASTLLMVHGRIAGVSGIFGGLLRPRSGDTAWRLWFVAGMIAAGAIVSVVAPAAFRVDVTRSTWAVALAGLLVGFGSRLGNGCTSGHGVCGLTRLSPRSMVATLTFMATGALAAFVVTQVFGGVL